MSVARKPSGWPKSFDSTSGGDGDESRSPLRLSVTRGRLGLEIYQPFDIGPLRIEHLTQSFVGLKFPLDLSGGVPAFRHRRGNLERVVVATDLDRLRRWSEPRLRSLYGGLARPMDLHWTESGAGLGLGVVRESSALAWEVHWVPVRGHARLVITNARGWGLQSPVMAEVIRAMDTLAGKSFERHGRTLFLRDAGRAIGRTVLPAAGARAPAVSEIAFGPLSLEDQLARVALDSSYTQAESNAVSMRAVELARVAREGDEALAKGELDLARNHYLSALESAPRQRELVLAIAEIDVLMGRIDSALGLISESMPLLASGPIGARSLLAHGENAAACEVLELTAREERYPPLCALLHLARAEHAPDRGDRRLTLDAAVAAAPALAVVRWSRLKERAWVGDADGAMSDAQHLEACANGRLARFAVCQRAAELLLDANLTHHASVLFQRALRYAPDAPRSMIGLARSLSVIGQGMKAIPLLERAAQAAESGPELGAALVELAQLIATKLNDLPHAVAQLRRVPQSDRCVVTARGLEGRYRFMLGDVIGASVAFTQVRDLIDVLPHDDKNASWLIEAGKFERDVMRDHAAAERHLALALRLCPSDTRVRELYREVASVLAAKRRRRGDGEKSPASE